MKLIQPTPAPEQKPMIEAVKETPELEVTDVSNIQAVQTRQAQQQNLNKITKNIVLIYPSDFTGCSAVRAYFPFNYISSVFGKSGQIIPLLSYVFIRQSDILLRARSIFFQRTMNVDHLKVIKEYRQLQGQLKYRTLYDLDDLLWGKNEDWGGDKFHGIPSYNFAAERVTQEMKDVSREAMDYVDVVTVSTPYLKYYLETQLKVKTRIEVMYNSVPQYLFGNGKERAPEIEDIKKPRILYNGSPTHYSNTKRQKGDFDNAWCEWCIKAVKNDEIELFVMGGLPFFFEEIKDKIKVYEWATFLNYPSIMRRMAPHFTISPLTPNEFNSAKSDVKKIEAYAIGSLHVGTVFRDRPSPYDDNLIKLYDDCSVADIDAVIKKYCQKDEFNLAVQKGYRDLEVNGRYTESQKFVGMLTRLF